ncbi:hypothetical protein P3L10_013962 [Capsicum annuum]
MEKAFTFFLLTLLLLMASSVMTKTNITTDQLALLSLKSQIIEDPFHLLVESWSPVRSVCQWLGVTCGSRHQRVKSLNLSNMALIGRIPREFGNLSFLVSLDLGSNNFHGNFPQEITHLRYIPEGIGNLHNTNLLGIQYNQLTGSIPFTIFNISRIEVIAFTGNRLSGNLPNGFCYGFPILKGLYLSTNKLRGHMPTSLSSCSQLQILSLSENEFDGPIHSEIGRLSNLQLLYLGFNHFIGMLYLMNTSLIVSNYFRNLFYYILTGGIIPQEIRNLVNLVELVTDKNHIIGSVAISIFNISFTGEIPKEISNLVEFEVLNLGYNSFSGRINMETFNISGLRKIALTNNNLSGIHPPNIDGLYLRNLTNLVGFLSLGVNNLTSDSSLSLLASLTNCRNLTLLSLSRNPLNGMLPVSVGNLSTSLGKFYADRCKIKGRIPYEVGTLSNLIDFDLNENN